MRLIKNICSFVLVPIALVAVLIYVLAWHYSDLENAIGSAGSIVQSVAIVIGGFWAYRKFGWEKRAESAVRTKAMLMKYAVMHSTAALEYRKDQDDNIGVMVCWIRFAKKMMPVRNDFASQIHLSIHLPPKIRKRLFDVVWLSVNKGKGPEGEDIDMNWKNFGKELQTIYDELDDIINQ